MFRWVRHAALAALVVSLLATGIGVGLFMVANDAWAPLVVPPWLHGVLGNQDMELWIPTLIGGWFVGALTVSLMSAAAMYYVWRRRQYEALIQSLERQLTELRNLPFTSPAPLEDLPEAPDAQTALLIAGPSTDDRKRDQGEL